MLLVHANNTSKCCHHVNYGFLLLIRCSYFDCCLTGFFVRWFKVLMRLFICAQI